MKKQQLTKTCLVLAIVLFASFLGDLSTVHADQASAQSQALAFIENVLPVDLTKYTVTFEKYSTIDGTIGDLKYNLSSAAGTIDIVCKVEKNVLTYCHIYPMNGPVISDQTYANVLDAVKSFLEKYQTYSKLDSTNFTAMLDNMDLTTDSVTVIGDTKLTITNIHFAEEDSTHFEWAYTANGADYSLLQVSFLKSGDFLSFSDNRAVYTIVDDSVNISREQAIDIALENLPSYSYKMPDKSVVSDFNVTKSGIAAELTVSRANYELRPYWDIRMPLNQTYPGSVQGITVFIWANSGEIISYSNIAYGGVEYGDSSNLDASSPSPETAFSLDTGFAVGVAVAAIGLVAASVVIIKKKKKIANAARALNL